MKKKTGFLKRRVVPVLVSVMLLGNTVQPVSTAVAASKVSLNKSGLALVIKVNGSEKTYGSQKLKVKKAKGVKIKKVTWKSSSKKIVVVSSAGKVTAKQEGKATITANVKYVYKKKTKHKKVKCRVRVSEKNVTPVEVSLNQTEAALTVMQDGNTIKKGKVTLKVNLSSGLTLKKVLYTSSDPSIASVDSEGVVAAEKMGAAEITAEAVCIKDGTTYNKEMKCQVSVKQEYRNIIKNLKIAHGVYCTFAGNAEGIKPYYQIKDGVEVSDDFFLWDCIEASIEDSSVAVLGENGLILGKKAGNTTITLKTTDGTEITKTAKIKVYRSREDVPVADDLYNSARSLYVPRIEYEWTVEDKERYVDENNNVFWSLSTEADMKYESNRNRLIKQYKTIEKQPDHTAGDAVASIVSTGEQMRTTAGEDAYYELIKEKIITPILSAGNTDELMEVCSSLGKEGIVTLLNTNQEFSWDIENYQDYYDIVVEGTKSVPDEPLDVSGTYIPLVSAEKLIDHRYLSEEKYSENEKKESMKKYIQTMFSYVDVKDQNLIDDTLKLALECENAKPDDAVELSYPQLGEAYPGLKLKECMEAYHYDNRSDDSLVEVRNFSMIDIMEEYATEKKLDALKGYAIIRALHDFGVYSPKGVAADFELMTAGSITDTEKREEIIDRLLSSGLDNIVDQIPWDFDQVYTDDVYEDGFKEETENLVERYVKTYRDAISNCWMGAKAKKNMLAKVDKMRFFSAFPDSSEYKGMEIQDDLKTAAENGTFGENLLLLKKYRNDLLHLLVGHKECERGWMAFEGTNPVTDIMGPWNNNAYYDNRLNAAYFCHVGLSTLIESNPKKDEELDAKNIAMMATTIGHEIGHSFDDEGSCYNADGQLQNLWDEQDKQVFRQKVDQLAAVYDTTIAYGDLENNRAFYQDGQNVVGEVLADLGGTEIALKLLKSTYQKDRTAEEMKSMIKEFYLYTALQWMTTGFDRIPEEYIDYYIKDVHPLFRQRTNGVASMMNDFYEVFDVKETDAMYYAPEDRVELWTAQ